MRELTLQELSQLHPLWNEKCRKVDKILVNHALQSQQDQGVGGRQTVEWCLYISLFWQDFPDFLSFR